MTFKDQAYANAVLGKSAAKTSAIPRSESRTASELSDEQARADAFVAAGWKAERASLYDEEGVEGWRWTDPQGDNDYTVMGHWDEPAPPPDCDLPTSAPSFTPGPWTVGSHTQDLVINGPQWETVCRIRRTVTGKANARLIIAAPDLLAALETLMVRFEQTNEAWMGDPAMVQARAALALVKDVKP
jgi:hypothetical protein